MGLIVFNIGNVASLEMNTYYFFNGTKWEKGLGSTYWELLGNNVSYSNFIGTKTNADLVMGTNLHTGKNNYAALHLGLSTIGFLNIL